MKENSIKQENTIDPELLEILCCPQCKSSLNVVKNIWLVCQNEQCGLKYPTKDNIPIMLIVEGMKWKFVAIDDLPVPAP